MLLNFLGIIFADLIGHGSGSAHGQDCGQRAPSSSAPRPGHTSWRHGPSSRRSTSGPPAGSSCRSSSWWHRLTPVYIRAKCQFRHASRCPNSAWTPVYQMTTLCYVTKIPLGRVSRLRFRNTTAREILCFHHIRNRDSIARSGQNSVLAQMERSIPDVALSPVTG
jgi:hypothetical protein